MSPPDGGLGHASEREGRMKEWWKFYPAYVFFFAAAYLIVRAVMLNV